MEMEPIGTTCHHRRSFGRDDKENGHKVQHIQPSLDVPPVKHTGDLYEQRTVRNMMIIVLFYTLPLCSLVFSGLLHFTLSILFGPLPFQPILFYSFVLFYSTAGQSPSLQPLLIWYLGPHSLCLG